MTVHPAAVVGNPPMQPVKRDAEVAKYQQQYDYQPATSTAVDFMGGVNTAATATTVPVLDTAATKRHRRSRSSTIDLGDAAEIATVRAAPAPPTLVNPWREPDREDFVIAHAKKSSVKCAACSRKIIQSELQLGAFYMHEDKFTLVKWYHQRCVVAPECLRSPFDLCGIEDVREEDLPGVLKWLGYDIASAGKDRSWTA